MADMSNELQVPSGETLMSAPDKMLKVRDAFGINSDMEVPAFSEEDMTAGNWFRSEDMKMQAPTEAPWTMLPNWGEVLFSTVFR